MSNNIFNIQRFGKLIYRKWFHPTNYSLRSILPFASLPILFLLFNMIGGPEVVSTDNRGSILWFLVVVSIAFAPFIFFFGYNDSKKGITDALLPASSLEKYLTMHLTNLIYSPIFVLVIYGFTDTLLSILIPSRMPGFAVAEFFNSLSLNWEKVLILFTFQQMILFCNLWFRRNKLLKTFGVFMIFHIILIGVVVGLFYLFIKDMNYIDGLTFNVYEGRGQSLIIKAGDHSSIVIIQLFRIFIDIIMPIGLVIGSYFMLKTKRY